MTSHKTIDHSSGSPWDMQASGPGFVILYEVYATGKLSALIYTHCKPSDRKNYLSC